MNCLFLMLAVGVGEYHATAVPADEIRPAGSGVGPRIAVCQGSPSFTGDTPMLPTSAILAALLSVQPAPVPPAGGIPRNEAPRNVRPWTPATVPAHPQPQPFFGVPRNEQPSNVRPYVPDVK